MWSIFDFFGWLWGDLIVSRIADRCSGVQILGFIVTVLAMIGVALLVWRLWLR